MTSSRSCGDSSARASRHEREPEIRLQTTLVKLIEDDRRHALERRIVLQHAA